MSTPSQYTGSPPPPKGLTMSQRFRNRFSVNPPSPPGWFQRHGKELVVGALVVGGIAVVGAVAWFVVSGLTGIGGQPPACTALQNELSQLQAQMMAIYATAAQQGGTFTASNQSEVQSLQTQIANVTSSMASLCIAAPGTSLTKTIDQLIAYSGWVAVAIVIALGIYVGLRAALAIRSLVKRWGGSKTSPGQPPKSPDDTDVPADFEPATMGTDVANAEVAGEFDSGTIDASTAQSTASSLAASDPALGVADQISAFFSQAASTASDIAAAILDALAAAWEAIVTALTDAYYGLIALLGL